MAIRGMPNSFFADALRYPGLMRPPSVFDRLGGALNRLAGGADDPRLSPEQNEQARRQAQLQAGLAMLASPNSGVAGVAQGLMYGQQAGAQGREMIYGQTAAERLNQALQDPTITGKLTPQQMALIRLLPPDQATKVLSDIAFAPAPDAKVVGSGGALVGPDGRVIYQNAPGVNLPADFDVALKSMGVDPATATAEQIRAAIPVYEQLKRSGATNVNVGGQQEFGNLNALATQFRTDIGDAQIVASSYGTVLAAAQDPSPAGDMALVFAYMKMLDPGSAVREGEYATAENAGSIPERIRAQYNKAIDGERFTPAQRGDFVDRAKRLAAQRQAQIQPVLGRYRRRAESANLDPSLIIFDPFAEVGPTDPFADLVPEGK